MPLYKLITALIVFYLIYTVNSFFSDTVKPGLTSAISGAQRQINKPIEKKVYKRSPGPYDIPENHLVYMTREPPPKIE